MSGHRSANPFVAVTPKDAVSVGMEILQSEEQVTAVQVFHRRS
jgi:hypothetical protein